MSLKDLFSNKENISENAVPTTSEGVSEETNKTNDVAENPVSGDNPVTGTDIPHSEGHVSTKEAEVLTPEDVKNLAPLYSDVVFALKQVFDPEIPVNIYDLGLIYELHISKSHEVYIKMTFTAPNCPMADEVMLDVKTSVEDVPGIKSCEIELTFDPVWDQSMLSEEARVELGFD